ncbi:MAG: M28 family peptidase [Candidatus Marinimicrobia bacterium]|nr:M28 family peptidase [Candidatus Neomarinimicrobiota bacterium]MDD4961950.1 M28 family peptidase [Candidatus Neomarinimicrobiota bacterium]MDD5709335.1 M28 family peptidase [Candidatus Neomarinimicrobiota bacterium]MDX9777860.1 M28 family peptidase [bacterium]
MKSPILRKLYLLMLLSSVCTVAAENLREDLQQDIRYLSSEKCRGRSYAAGGIFHAERYIVRQLKDCGIRVFRQTVPYTINVTLETPLCVLNGDTLRPGYDFIPHPYSASFHGHFCPENMEIYGEDTLKILQDSLDLFSVSAVRRHIMQTRDGQKRSALLLFPEEDILQSKQDKRYYTAALQIRASLLEESPKELVVAHRSAYKKLRSHNIIALIPGSSDSLIMLTAHYDHMGDLGTIYYPGANDNASGTAVLMALARHYAEDPPACSLLVCLLTGEEQGLLGAEHFAASPRYDPERVICLINLDMVGSGHKGYGMVNGAACPKEAAILQEICETLDFGECRIRDNSPNSDHYPFTKRGLRAIFLYSSGGEQPYHHPDDIAKTLDWDVLEQTVFLIREFIDRRSAALKTVAGQ